MKKICSIILFFSSLSVSAQIVDKAGLLSDIKMLSSGEFEGRKTGTPGNRLAADFISQRFNDLGLNFYNPGYKHPFNLNYGSSGNEKGTNIIGYICGKTDKQIVISAHYDHLGMDSEHIFYGADDNASGVSALLSIASYFKKHPPVNTLIFIAFDAEEAGLKGSYAFLRDPSFNKKAISLNVNMDMLAHNDKGELFAVGTYHYPEIRKIIDKEDRNTGIKLLFGHDQPKLGKDDWTMQSDQGAFSVNSIPYVYFGVEDHADYHKTTDTFEHINQDFFFNATTVVLKSIIKLDKELNSISKNEL